MGMEHGKIKNFRDLEIWQLAMEIIVTIYELTKRYPREELFGLVSQMRRASLSIASNIAEGFNRFHNKEYRQFLYVALGSCAELETQIEVCFLLNYVSQQNKDTLLEKLDHESRMINNLIKRLSLSPKGEGESGLRKK